MIADPYKVLGVDPGCTDAELKKSYRDLSKRWHPDQNPNNEKMAEERFKEIQEAYRQIVDGQSSYGQSSYSGQNSQQGGSGYADYGYGSFFNQFNQWQQYSSGRRQEQESSEEMAARNYINSGYYREALNALEGVEIGRRGAKWYYYAAMANQGLGNNVTALEYAKRASDMEPDNMIYASFLSQLNNSGSWYQRQNVNYGFGGMGRAGNSSWCLSIIMLNLCCNLMGGRIFWC